MTGNFFGVYLFVLLLKTNLLHSSPGINKSHYLAACILFVQFKEFLLNNNF